MKLELQKGSRSKLLAFLLFTAMSLFVLRLFYLQIVKHDYYVGLASEEQVKRLTIPAKRGSIYALDNGSPVALVLNQTVYTVFADPQVIDEDDESDIVTAIKEVAGGNAKSDLKALLAKKESRYQVLATGITRTQANKLKEKDLSGIGFQQGTKRVYSEGSLASQTLGFVNSEGLGQYGIEGGLNSRLTGTDGLLQSVTDVSSVPLTIGDDLIDQPAIDGDNLVLSIDRNIQSHVEKALADALERTGATDASAIVMDPNTGQIMAMANLPTYNPSELNSVKDISVFNNKVISAPYEPGSDIKALTMATGIDKGVVTPSSTYNNTDYIEVEDITISNAYKGETGIITFQHALNWSLNTGFVTIAQKLGDGTHINRSARDTMYDYFYNRFKLGQLTGVELYGEAAGTVISPEETEGNAVRYSNMAFGQGLEATMIQVASAFCSIVNGGYYYQPTVLAGVIDSDGNYVQNKIGDSKSIISKSAADQVKEMTHIARSTFFSSVDRPGYYTGGKTGTSQVIINGEYSSTETVGTYLGYGGSKETSNYVIMVQISGKDKVLEGAKHALPIFTDISNWMINYLGLQPKE